MVNFKLPLYEKDQSCQLLPDTSTLDYVTRYYPITSVLRPNLLRRPEVNTFEQRTAYNLWYASPLLPRFTGTSIYKQPICNREVARIINSFPPSISQVRCTNSATSLNRLPNFAYNREINSKRLVTEIVQFHVHEKSDIC